MDTDTDKTVELEDEALDAAAGGTIDGTSNRAIIAVQPENQATKHPAKVTIPDLKLSVGY
jgi:hypothetical protein